MTDRRAMPAGAFSDQMTAMISDWQKASVGMFFWTSPVWVKIASNMGAEVAQFVTGRIHEDLRTQGEILQCRDPVKLREIQGRYLKTAFDQYCVETGKLVRMNRAALDTLTGCGTSG